MLKWLRDRREFSVKLKSGQELNRRELDLLEDGLAEGFLVPEVSRRGTAEKLIYQTDGLVPLPEFLGATVLSKRMFSMILAEVFSVRARAEQYHFNKQLIVFDRDHVFVDPSTWRVLFIYVPVQPYAAKGNFRELLLDLVRLSAFDQNENTDYVGEYIRIVNTGASFSAYAVEEYCQRLAGGMTRGGEEQLAHENEAVLGKAASVGAVPPTFANASAELSVSEDENGVVTVFRGTGKTEIFAWLENLDRAEKITIKKTPFRIGKMEAGSDYRIDNGAVSRKHADIIKEQGCYYVMDLNSTNGTFLDGKRIQCGVKEKLREGAELSFANAKYKFHEE